MRVTVFGAGYAGLTVARRLERSLPDDVELLVVDDTGNHRLKHELHRLIRRPDLVDVIEIPLAELLDRAALRTGRVTDVDPEAGVATVGGGSLPYDYAAVCLGAETAYHDLPGVAEHATPIERPTDTTRIREDLLALLETGGRVVVGGGGLSGIQVAGELAALADERDAGGVEVLLAEQLETVAPGFPAAFQRAVREELAGLGVAVRTGTTVTGATATAVETAAGPIDYDQLVWTGGIRGPDALAGERPTVRPTLRLGDGTFVLGDAARIVDRDGAVVPASAQAALRAAPVAARNIARLVAADRGGDPGAFAPPLDRFAFEPIGWTVSVGDAAVAAVGETVLRGAAARSVKAAAGVNHLGRMGRVEEALAVAADTLD